MDHLLNEANEAGLSPGKMYILPSSFAGSPRNMPQNYQDAMAIVRKYGKPNLFITMTCNPKWEDTVNNLQHGQTVDGQPHLVARVFHLNLKALIDDICKKHIFGFLKAMVYVLQFQKRGLPHAHILLILKESCKPKNEELIDKIVSAEIPNIEITPRLHAIVTKHMIHGPCGALNPNSPCMTNDKCSKDFPKEFQIKTVANSNGYPKYKRRNTGQSIILNGKKIDNSWVVPYNPYLALKYNCYINVEVCASVKSIKYLFKYVYKGHDYANVVIQEQCAISFEDLRIVHGNVYPTFREGAKAKGLINDDQVWENTMEDAVQFLMPKQLRELFAYICVFASLQNMNDLILKYDQYLIEDLVHKHQQHNDDCTICRIFL
ncbi:uncharacterized protein LOC120523396 [Polypterus senegalus]|uniref:uncharacterized protein LOC120523396 n=1 Tax=Polypterus senegalus TaxID=55291 RepID=UPI001964A5D3|nr:uncharacterized protein LOC120523396 [Polypterus senegalus]